jgi:serine/threonine protein kinase
MVLYYAKDGSLNNWNNWIKNERSSWMNDIYTLKWIIRGLREIHEKKMVHRDFHIGNILLEGDDSAISFISDMGLCGEVGNIDDSKIYGVMPYVAPEVLRGKPYTQAADVYSFSMIMYFAATGRQPFANRIHDGILALDICNGIRPEVNELEAPKCYVELMKRCWDSSPDNKPDPTKIYELFLQFRKSYGGDILIAGVCDDEIKKQFKEAREYRKAKIRLFIDNIVIR